MSPRLAWTFRQTSAAFAYRRSNCSMTHLELERDLLEAIRYGQRDEIRQIVPLLRGARYINSMKLRAAYVAEQSKRAA